MRTKNILGLVSFIVFMISTPISGAETGDYPPEVSNTLEAAGDNRNELEKVLTHYATGDYR